MVVIWESEVATATQSEPESSTLGQSLMELTDNAIFCGVAPLASDASAIACGIDFDYVLERYLEGSALPDTYAVEVKSFKIPTRFKAYDQIRQASDIWHLFLGPQDPGSEMAVYTVSSDAVGPLHNSLLQEAMIRAPWTEPSALSMVPRLLQLTGLPRGWDGYEGQPIVRAVVARAIETLNYLAAGAARRGVRLPPPEIGPSPAGSIHFEWDLPSAYFDLECPQDREPLSY